MSTVDTPDELRSVSRSLSITPSEPSFESFELEAHLRDTPSPGLPFYTPHSNHEPCHTLAFDEFALFYHRQLAINVAQAAFDAHRYPINAGLPAGTHLAAALHENGRRIAMLASLKASLASHKPSPPAAALRSPNRHVRADAEWGLLQRSLRAKYLWLRLDEMERQYRRLCQDAVVPKRSYTASKDEVDTVCSSCPLTWDQIWMLEEAGAFNPRRRNKTSEWSFQFTEAMEG